MAISRVRHLLLLTKQQQHLLISSSSSSSSSQSLQSTTLCDQNPQDETLISSVVSILKEQRTKNRWNFIRTLHPNGFSSNEVSQITLHLRNNPRLALRFFLWSEKESLCTHDLQSYSTIIHILARARLKTLAQTLIQTAIRVSEATHFDDQLKLKPPKLFESLTKTYRSCDSAPFVFDLLIRACLDTKKIDSALTIVRMLRSRSIYPKASTCNSLIRFVSKTQGSDEGFLIYREIFGLEDCREGKPRIRVSPNVQTFNTLMLCFYQDGMMDKVEEMWNEMKKMDCVPNVFSYGVRMAAFCDRGNIEKAVGLWEDMKDMKLEPDVMGFNTLIKGFCDNGEVGKAEELFQEMELRGVETTCLTYEHLMKGYCRSGDVDSAILLYKDMCRKHFRPEASTVDEVIGEMCIRNRVSEGLKFLKDVMRKGDVFPSVTTFTVLIRGLCEDGNMEEALMLQAEMVGKGFEPNVEIYGAFIEGYKNHGDEEKAGKLRREMFELGLQ